MEGHAARRVGGAHVKVLATGRRTPRKIPSGPSMTAQEMVSAVKQLTAHWRYNVVSIGYPGLVIHGRPVADPHKVDTGLFLGTAARVLVGHPDGRVEVLRARGA